MDQKEPLFFLFTCVKDGRQYISKLFESLLSQTEINFVHYIYEDGSIDGIEDLVKEYKRRANLLKTPIRVIYEKQLVNIGLNRATQHCIAQCFCPYFIWIDCDNYVDKNFFKELGKLARKNKKSLLLRSKAIYSNNGNINFKISNQAIKELQYFLRSKYYYSFFAVNYNKYRKINKDNIMLSEKTFYNDDQIILLLLTCKAKISFSKKAICYFVEREGSESSFGPVISKTKVFQLDLLKKINIKAFNMLKCYYDCKEQIPKIDYGFKNDPKNNYKNLKQIYKKCSINNLPYSVLHYKTKFLNFVRYIYFSILKG